MLALQHLAAGQVNSQTWLVWVVHNHQGGDWTSICADGRIRVSRGDDSNVVGTVPCEEVSKLAATILERGLLTHQPTPTPMPQCSLEVVSGDDRLRWDVPAADLSEPRWHMLPQQFAQLRQQAASADGAATAPRPSNDTLIVQLHKRNYTLAVIGGVCTCGVLALVLWLSWRKFPASMNATGVTTKGGREIAWSDLTVRHRVTPDGNVMGYDLLASDGTEIRLAPGAFIDGARITRFALEHVATA